MAVIISRHSSYCPNCATAPINWRPGYKLGRQVDVLESGDVSGRYQAGQTVGSAGPDWGRRAR